MKNIFIFGDSLPLGRGISSDKSWPVLLSKSFSELEHRDLIIYNLAVAGDTTERLVERMKFELEARKPSKDSTIIFQIGINDGKNIGKIGKRQVSLSGFENNINRLIITAREYTTNIIFLGITPVDESLSYQPDVYYFFNQQSHQYNMRLKDICDNYRIDFVDILDSWLKGGYKSYVLSDGIHLNKSGHQKIFKLVLDKISANLQ